MLLVLIVVLQPLALLPFGCFRPEVKPLEEMVGRSEVRVWSAPYPLGPGGTVKSRGIPERMERLGYRRVKVKPEQPGEYFWGRERFWVYRRGHRWGGRDWAPVLLGLFLEPKTGEIRSVVSGRERPLRPGEDGAWLEPELLAESLDGRVAPRLPVRLAELPERVWRPVLAAEDHRFFDHHGVDARSLARAAIENARRGRVAQGGSTITQQLVKNRDLTPTRSLGRKVSEALRALDVEADHGKEEILETYLNHVYLGQVDGLAVHGWGAGARAFFGKPAAALQVHEAALLAGLIRSPNGLSPARHPEAATKRRNQVLAAMAQWGWLSPAEAAAAQQRPLGLHPVHPTPAMAGSFIAWVGSVARGEAGGRLARGRGVVIETTLDPLLQATAESAVVASVAQLRRQHRELRGAPLGVALVAVDPDTGAVLAYVGSPPGSLPGGFDRARQGRRQPGSLVKPLALLEAFDDCGGKPLYPATRVADEALAVPLPRGASGEAREWRPVNADNRFLGVVTIRDALRDSRNVPFVRVVERCGAVATIRRVNATGLRLPEQAPPSWVLGAIEATPLQVARAYTVFASPGDALMPLPLTRIERPGGSRIERFYPRRQHVVRPASAYLVIDLLREAARAGTARAAAVDGLVVAAKTGTTSERRDAWLAGHAGGLVTVVWVGRDDGRPLGLTGSQAATPLWRDLMRRGVRLRPPRHLERPIGVVDRWIDQRTGLLVGESSDHGRRDVFRDDALPPRDRFWRSDEDVPVLR